MASAKDLMRLAHQQKRLAAAPNTIEKPVIHHEQPPQQQEVIAETKTSTNRMQPKTSIASLPSSVKKVARPDLDPSTYGVSPWKSNFDVYNKELVEFIRNFSANNQLNGGCAITKSQLIEVILDVIYYDLKLDPIGFESVQELRKYLQDRIREDVGE
jgi:hypothetical protein